MNRWHFPLKRLLRFLLGLFLRVEWGERELVPAEGPVVIYFNHSNWIDPLVAAAMVDREVAIMGKAQLFRVPIVRMVLRAYGVFPVRRQEGDLRAFRTALSVLERGAVLIVAPEGTRSHDGVLQRGKPGMVYLALRSDAWVQPVAILGVLEFRRHVRRLRRTPVQVRFGQPFKLPWGQGRPSHQEGLALIDEAMYKLAALMPPELRGFYADADVQVAALAACSASAARGVDNQFGGDNREYRGTPPAARGYRASHPH